MIKGYRLTTNAENKTMPIRYFTWRWMSQQHCNAYQGFGCYFNVEQQAENKCKQMYQNNLQNFGNQTIDQALNQVPRNLVMKGGKEGRCAHKCPYTNSTLPWLFTLHSVTCCDFRDTLDETTRLHFLRKYRKSYTEYLFSGGLSEIVKNEVILQMKQVFGGLEMPENLITVHIRWGNKSRETTLIPAEPYAKAILKIVEERGWKNFNIYRGRYNFELIWSIIFGSRG